VLLERAVQRLSTPFASPRSSPTRSLTILTPPTSRKASGSNPPTSVRLSPVHLVPSRLTPPPAELEEDGVRIALTIVDTPGFGDNIDNEFALVSICSLGTFLLTRLLASKKSLGTLSVNMMTSWPKSLASSVIPASVTTEFTLCSTSSLLQGIRT
jgi:hypothetical protein